MTTVNELQRGQKHRSQVARRAAPVRRAERVPPHQRRHDRLHLDHSVLDADAVPVARAERYERVRVSAAARVRQEVVRVEPVRVGVELPAALHEQRTDGQRRT